MTLPEFWFVLVGWWLGFWAIVAAYFCLVLIVPSPIGIAIHLPSDPLP